MGHGGYPYQINHHTTSMGGQIMETSKRLQHEEDKKGAIIELAILICVALFSGYTAIQCGTGFAKYTGWSTPALIVLAGLLINVVITFVCAGTMLPLLFFALGKTDKQTSLLSLWLTCADDAPLWGVAVALIENIGCVIGGFYGCLLTTQLPMPYPTELGLPILLMSVGAFITSFLWLLIQFLRFAFIGKA